MGLPVFFALSPFPSPHDDEHPIETRRTKVNLEYYLVAWSSWDPAGMFIREGIN